MEEQNARVKALQNASERTARALVLDPTVKVVVAGTGASYAWRTKTLYLPQFSEEPADPRLANAFRGLVDHECGHVAHTDFNTLELYIAAWKAKYGPKDEAKISHLANAYEDIWMERAWALDHRGSRAHFADKNAYVGAKTGGAGPTGPEYVPAGGETPVGAFGAFTQAITRVGRAMIKLDEVHPDTMLLVKGCWNEIQAGWGADTTREACEAAEATWIALQHLAEPPPPPPAPPGEGSGGGAPGEGGEGTPSPGSGNPGEGGEGGEGTPAPGEGGGGEGAAPSPGEGPGGSGDAPNQGGRGAVDGPAREAAAEACGGEWGKLPDDAAIIGREYVAALPHPPYVVDPLALASDEVVTYNPAQRKSGKEALKGLMQAAGPVTAKLTARMRQAIAASRMSLTVGGMEEGDEIDEDALSGIALGIAGADVFQQTFRKVDESAYVVVLVDNSGSMGSSKPGERRDPKTGAIVPVLNSKAGYAAVAAAALHDALRMCRVPHAVLGYTTTNKPHGNTSPNERLASGYMKWSRQRHNLQMHVFVPSPGLHDVGDALPFITGRAGNLDGESVMWAARYAAAHGGDYDRVILLVVADGMPAGADDGKIEDDYLTEAVERTAQANIEVYGIGVGIEGHEADWERFYPNKLAAGQRAPTGNLMIPDEEGITDTVLRELTGLLTRGYGRSRL